MPDQTYRIRGYQTADEDAVIDVWLAATIPGQAFLPELHWREMEPDIRDLQASAEVWVIDGPDGIIAFVALLEDLIGGFVHPPEPSEFWPGGSARGPRQVPSRSTLRRRVRSQRTSTPLLSPLRVRRIRDPHR
jgi:hypothetical protein